MQLLLNKTINHIHLIGIGGVGMSGIAALLLRRGYSVSGSDVKQTPITKMLQTQGAKIAFHHHQNNIQGADLAVYSSAIKNDNVEILAAKANNINVVHRAKLLADLMNDYQGITVAGSHGKTTTTSLIAHILMRANLDPAFSIGGYAPDMKAYAAFGEGDYFVVEADESDASLVCFSPDIAIVTNIDSDHLDAYNNDYQQLKNTFIDILNKLPDSGLAIICIDDPGVQSIADKITANVITYGFNENADICLSDHQQKGLISTFTVKQHGYEPLRVKLNLAGKHNALNSLAALALARQVEIDDQTILQALNSFQGVGRRFSLHGTVSFNENTRALLVEDYSHHPAELAVTIEAARHAWPERRIVTAFQPHRYSRTKALMKEFVTELNKSDVVILTDVYPAGELPSDGIQSDALHQKIHSTKKDNAHFVGPLTKLASHIEKTVQNDDVILLLGAGDINTVASSWHYT